MSEGRSAIRKVSVAVVSWNGRRHLETLLPALRAQRDPGVEWEVLLLDNGSRDGSADWVAREHPWVRLVESDVNLGFSAGNNRLVELAGGDAVALLNNDTRPAADWLAALVDALRAAPPDVAAVSGLIVDWEGERLDFGRGVMTFDGHAFQLGFRRPLEDAAHLIPDDGAELPFACGGNLLVRRDAFRAAGGFDPDYFAYLEDVDLGWRLWSGGERVCFARDARVHHRSGATSDLLGLYNRGFLFERNAFLTVHKNYDERLWPRLMPAVLLTFLSRTDALLAANPGADQLAVDPYAGHIADTGRAARGEHDPASPARLRDLPERWRRWGTVELARRMAGRLKREIAARLPGRAASPPPPVLTDPRTIAQLRSLHDLLARLDPAADKRRAVQRRRRRPDCDYFERFPPYLVATYPGDEALFASPGFRLWLPDDPKLVETRLEEIMEIERP